MKPIAYPSPRVLQLDSHVLDSELHSLLSSQLSTVFAHLGPKSWLLQLNPRLYTLLLRVLVFRCTVWRSATSYGLGLQNLRLADKSTGRAIGHLKKIALLAALVSASASSFLYSYLSSVEDSLDDSNNPRLKRWLIGKSYLVLVGADKVAKLLSLANFISFLVNGKYASLLNRVLGITLNPIATDLAAASGESVSYEFQNRQLAWTVMTELAIFTLPLLKVKKLQRVALGLKRRLVAKSGDVSTNEVELPPYAHLSILQCAYCVDQQRRSVELASAAKFITNPMKTNCGHVFCYVCIVTALHGANTDGEPAKCLRCNHAITWFEEHCSHEEVPSTAILFGPEDEKDEQLGSKLVTKVENRQDQSDSADDAEDETTGDEYSEDEDFQEDDFEVD